MNIIIRYKWSKARELVIIRRRQIIEKEHSRKRVERKVKNLPFSFDDEHDYLDKSIKNFRQDTKRIESRRFGLWYCLFGSSFPFTTDVGL